MDGPAFTFMRRLYTNDSGTIVTNEIVCCGSNPVTGSLWSVSLRVPRFLGVCASAGSSVVGRPLPLASPATAAAPPAFSRSRRVMELETGCWSMSTPPRRPATRPRSPSGYVGCSTAPAAILRARLRAAWILARRPPRCQELYRGNGGSRVLQMRDGAHAPRYGVRGCDGLPERRDARECRSRSVAHDRGHRSGCRHGESRR